MLYLFELEELLSDSLIFRLQLGELQLQPLLLLQYLQSVLGRLDLLLGRLPELPAQTLHLGTEPLRPGLGHQDGVVGEVFLLLLHGHLGGWTLSYNPGPTP